MKTKKITLYPSNGLFKWIEEQAKKANRSVNNFLLRLVEEKKNTGVEYDDTI